MMNIEDFKLKYQKKEVLEELNEAPKNPLVSVLVQTYQHVDYIKMCLDSILMQKTNFEFEIILGEDASDDGTREICLNYAKQHPNKIRLFLHYRENNIHIGGSPTGRFILISNLMSARGKYIALCEGDDYWTDPLKLQKQVDFLDSNPNYAACFTNAIIVNQEKNTNQNFILHEYNGQYNFKNILRNGGGFFPTASLVFRNNTMELSAEVMKHKSGDRALVMLLAEHGKFYLLNQFTCVYRQHPIGIFTSISENSAERLKIDLDDIELYRTYNNYTKYKYNSYITELISNASQRILFKYNNKITNEVKQQLYKNLKFIDYLRLVKNKLFSKQIKSIEKIKS